MTGNPPHPRSTGVLQSIRRRSPIWWLAILGVGLLATVLTAWQPWKTRTTYGDPSTPAALIEIDGRLFAISLTHPGHAQRTVFIYPAGVANPEIGPGPAAWPRDRVPSWLPRGVIAHPERAGLSLVTRAQADGWPLPCLYSVEGVATSGGLVQRRGVAVKTRRPITYDRVFPFGVLWGGMLVNTAAFGLGALLLAEFAGAMRRGWRTRRSRCAWCGYDLAGAPAGVCPECGAAWRAEGECP